MERVVTFIILLMMSKHMVHKWVRKEEIFSWTIEERVNIEVNMHLNFFLFPLSFYFFIFMVGGQSSCFQHLSPVGKRGV